MAARVLIVDDHDEVRQMLAILFRAEGCDVSEADSGMAAMREYWKALDEGRPFRLVVMDLAMPKMDGMTTVGRIRGAESATDAPRTIVYGYTGHADRLHSQDSLKRAGFDFVAVKPGDPREFKRLARELEDGD